MAADRHPVSPHRRLPPAAALALAWLVVASGAGCRQDAPASPAVAAAIPRFDAHAHLGPADYDAAARHYARQGIVGFANFSGGHGPMLDQALAAAAPHGGRVVVLASWNARGLLRPGWVEREVNALRLARQKGVRGFKVHKALGLGYPDPDTGGRLHIDDPRLDPIFEECAALGLPVAIHSGDPKAFFQPPTPDNERYAELRENPGWSFYGPGFPTWEEVFGEYERLVARHPQTTFIGVHFGNTPEEPARAARMLERHPNLMIDTAARLGEIGRRDREGLRRLFLTHRKRILFGTDFSLFDGEITLGAPDGTRPGDAETAVFFERHWRFFHTLERGLPHPTPIQGAWTIDGIGLPEDVLHDLYHRNAERLFGLAPLTRPAN